MPQKCGIFLFIRNIYIKIWLFIKMISKRNIRKKIDFSSEELEDLNIKNEDGRIT